MDGVERWDATDTVDLDELARLTEALVQSGVNGMVAMGTTGECATLTNSEWEQAAACVIETVRRRVPAVDEWADQRARAQASNWVARRLGERTVEYRAVAEFQR